MIKMLQDLKTILTDNLDKLSLEITSFKEEATIWQTTGNVTNTAGNLCLHLIGNLNTYIGSKLGNSGYIRNRPAEFSIRDVPKEELLKKIAQTKKMVELTLERLRESDLAEDYPEQVLGFPMTTGYFLVHLSAHLAYHLGQINYMRRILE